EAVLAHVGDPHPGDDRQRERAVDEALTEFRALGVFVVEVDLVGVVGEQREPDIVRLGDRAAEPALIDVADGEILEVAALPAGLYRHDSSFDILSFALYTACGIP